MKLINSMRLISIAAVLGIQFLNPASAASHMEAPLLALHSVIFESSRPVFDADGNLVAVDQVRFSGTTAEGHEIGGSGELSLSGQIQDDGQHAMTGRIDAILGRVRHTADATYDRFTGLAQVTFDSVSVDQRHFEATGGMRLQLEILEPALVREFDIVADAVQSSDGTWSARFRGEDRLGLGVRIEGFYDSYNNHRPNDTGIMHLQGDVEALAWLDSRGDSLLFEDMAGEEQFVFDDTDGAERLYFIYDDRGRLSDIEASAEVEGRFSARLTLRLIGDDGASNDDVLYIRVGDVIVSESERAPDDTVSGRAEVFFSGVGERDGVAVTVNGTAEFRFAGEITDGTDGFMRGHWLQLSATLEDAETGGALLFADLSGYLGQATIVGTIDPSGQVDLSGGLGQVTALDKDLDT